MTTSLRENIYQTLKDDITYGKISPGEKINEPKLVDRFKSSRSPIREALRQLESEGLIVFERNKGMTVPKLSIKEIEDIYDLRSFLEGYAARLASKKIQKDQLIYLKGLHEKLKKAAKNSDLLGWIRNNILFHDFLSENSGNRILHQTLSSLKRRVYRYHYTIISNPGNFKTFIAHHEKILRACEKNDCRMAERIMNLHIEVTKKVLIDYLDKFPVL